MPVEGRVVTSTTGAPAATEPDGLTLAVLQLGQLAGEHRQSSSEARNRATLIIATTKSAIDHAKETVATTKELTTSSNGRCHKAYYRLAR